MPVPLAFRFPPMLSPHQSPEQAQILHSARHIFFSFFTHDSTGEPFFAKQMTTMNDSTKKGPSDNSVGGYGAKEQETNKSIKYNNTVTT